MENHRRYAIFAAGLLGASSMACPSRERPAPLGFVTARPISDAADLIGGPRAEGRIGDFLLANDQVRVVVGAAGSSAVFNPFGGQLLDADVTRSDGEPGQDRFGESFPSVNFLTVSEVDLVEVVEDGSSRRRASLRVRGQGYPFPIVPEIPGLTGRVEVDFETVYSLTPESSSVLIETTVTMNEPEKTLVQAYDVLLLGEGLDLFGAPIGTAESGSFDWYGGDAAGVAYAWVPLGEPSSSLHIPFSNAGQQIAGLGPLDIPSGGRRTFRRRLAIAAPDLGALGREIARIRGQATGTLSGLVRDTVGMAVPDAFLLVSAPGVDRNEDGQDDRVTRIRSGPDGAYTTELPPGTYRAVVSAAGRGEGSPLEFTIAAGKTAQALFVLPAIGHVTFAATDASDGAPIPAKLTLVRDGSVAGRALAGAAGTGSAAVPPGSYTAYVSRGPEWEVRASAVQVSAGGSTAVPAADAALSRRVSTPGFLAGDFHLHSIQSRDSAVPLPTRVLSLAAEGLEFVTPTDHDRATDYTPAIFELGLEQQIVSVPGSEVSVPLYGHFNAYPMPGDAVAGRAFDGSHVWFDRALGRALNGVELVEKLRAWPGGDRVIQMNHPRSSQGYLDAVGYDPETGLSDEPVAWSFDTIEVNGQTTPVAGSAMTDWFSFLRQGHRITAVGVSDSHSTWNPGYPRTLFQAGTDDPTLVGNELFVDAMRSGRVTVSSGPFMVTSAATAASSVGLGGTLDATGGEAVEIRVRIQSPAWAPYDQLRLYENGILHTTQALSPPLVGGAFVSDLVLPVAPGADSFYVVVVTGGGSLFPVSGHGIYAYTNAVYVDRAPAGWTPPGL